jgi:ferrochelatase
MLGVVLFQLGGPNTAAEVEPFLYNLFRDPDIIDFPFARLAREPLARLVANRRARKVAGHYGELYQRYGGSPLNNNTRRQAEALEAELQKTIAVRVVVANRYWHPLTEEAIGELQRAGCDQVVLLPLYPQYSKTTTGSSLNEWKRRWNGNGIPVRVIRDYHDYGPYIDAQVFRIQEKLATLPPGEPVHLVFSAHGIPSAEVDAGDPYPEQVAATTRFVLLRGGWTHPYTICYQSKVGPGRWLQPTLLDTLRQIGAQRMNALVAPISFVSDHIETLHEIDEEAREEAARYGIPRFAMTEGLNDSPAFIRALAGLVTGAAA